MSKNFFLKSLAAIVLSLTLHTGVLAYFSVSEKAEIAGGAVSELDVLGNDFQDLVQEGDNLEPVKADQVEKVKDNYEVEPIKSREVSTTRSQTPLLQVAKPLKQLKSIKPVSSKTIKQQDKPKKALQKTKSKKVLTKKHSQKKQGVKTAKSTINKKKGRIDGIAAGKANNKGKNANKPQKAGNSKVSNYPGKVQRRIARTRSKRVGGQGIARVRFVISDNGRIARISLSESSGSAHVDKAAIDHIRRAAPFPKPPQGARRRFVIPVRVRG